MGNAKLVTGCFAALFKARLLVAIAAAVNENPDTKEEGHTIHLCQAYSCWDTGVQYLNKRISAEDAITEFTKWFEVITKKKKHPYDLRKVSLSSILNVDTLLKRDGLPQTKQFLDPHTFKGALKRKSPKKGFKKPGIIWLSGRPETSAQKKELPPKMPTSNVGFSVCPTTGNPNIFSSEYLNGIPVVNATDASYFTTQGMNVQYLQPAVGTPPKAQTPLGGDKQLEKTELQPQPY